MKKIVFLFLIMLMVTACGSINGSYKLVEMTEEKRQVNISSLSDVGLVFELEIKNNDDVILTTANVKRNLKIEDNNFVGVDDEGNKRSLPFEKDGNRITIYLDEDKMVFEKK